MDVSDALAEHASKFKSVVPEEGDVPVQVDAGMLAVFDANVVDEEGYRADVEEYLRSRTRNGMQALVNAIFSLPTTTTTSASSSSLVLASLPAPTTHLPREKPVPKPKPLTKWERFAKAKGIEKRKKEKMEWDDERKEWRPVWGYKGKNKDAEEQWLHEVSVNADDDANPALEARKARKERVERNEERRKRNMELDAEIDRTRTSTASVGRFDSRLPGDEGKVKGVKRKFEPNEGDMAAERASALSLLSSLGHNVSSSSSSKKRSVLASAKRPPPPRPALSKKQRSSATVGERRDRTADKPAAGGGKGEGEVNVRKAVRFASAGGGATAIVGGKGGRGGKAGKKKGGRR